MFSSPQKQQPTQRPQDISPGAAIGIFAILGAAVFSTGNGQRKLEAFYFNYFEWIHFAGYALIAAFAAVVLWAIIRNTKDLTQRMRQLSPVTKPAAGVLAGKTSDGLEIHVPDNVRTGHVQVIGATGRGKTESIILPWMIRDLGRGCSAVLIDGKGDPELAEKVRGASECLRKPAVVKVFDLGSPSTSKIINPLSHGTAQQITDRIFTALSFKEEFYKSVQYDICQMVVALIHDTASEKTGSVTFRKIYDLLSDDDLLSDLSSACSKPELGRQVYFHLMEPRQSRDKNCKGLMSQLAPLAVGEVAELVNGITGDDKSRWMSISEIVTSQKSSEAVAGIFLIPTLMYQEIGQQLGRMLLQELSWAVGQRANSSSMVEFCPVFLDEFSAFVYPGFTNVLNKARSSGVALHLSHQSLGDLMAVSEEFGTIVNTNTNVKCLLGLNDPETADFFARHIGTAKDEKMTERAKKQSFLSGTERTGDMSIREVESYKVHPNDLKNFTRGEGVLHMPSPLGNITEVIQFAKVSDKESYFR